MMNGISQLLDSLQCIMLAVDAMTSQKEPCVQRTNTRLTCCQTGHEYSSQRLQTLSCLPDALGTDLPLSAKRRGG